MIEACAFGIIMIDGKKYTSDLIIYPDGRVEDRWWRKNGHRLSEEDIRGLIASMPRVIIAGSGVSGQMRVEPELEALLADKGIRFVSKPNQKAMEIYNELSASEEVGACFHLTC